LRSRPRSAAYQIVAAQKNKTESLAGPNPGGTVIHQKIQFAAALAVEIPLPAVAEDGQITAHDARNGLWRPESHGI
jgi:hypothetical protein